MSVNNIPSNADLDPLKRQQMQVLKQASKEKGVENKTNQSKGDSVEISQMAKEVSKYKKEIQGIPEPNEGRIEELKQAVNDGTLLNKGAIEGAAAAISNMIMK